MAHKFFLVVCIGIAVWPASDWGESLKALFSAWNSNEYVELSREGYLTGQPTTAFYPFLPFLIRLLGPLFSDNAILTGLVISNLAGVAGHFLFYKLVWHRFGPVVARLSLGLLLCFPGAMFFSFIYTESLFFLELIAVFYAIDKNRITWAVLPGFLMPLTRPIGGFIGIVLVCYGLFLTLGKFTTRDSKGRATVSERNLGWRWMAVGIFPLLGLVCYFGLMWHWTGDPFEGLKAQRFYSAQGSISNIFSVHKWGSAFLLWGSLHGVEDSVVDRVFFLIFLTSLYWIWKLDKMYFIWAVCAGLIPALSNSFVSYSRYVMMVFPLFVLLSLHSQERSKRWIWAYYLPLFACLQAYFIFRFANHQWAG